MSLDKIYVTDVSTERPDPTPGPRQWKIRLQINEVYIEGLDIHDPRPSDFYKFQLNDYVRESAHVLARKFARLGKATTKEHAKLGEWHDDLAAYTQSLWEILRLDFYRQTRHDAFRRESTGCIIYIIDQERINEYHIHRPELSLQCLKWELLETASLGEGWPSDYNLAVSRVVDAKDGVRKPYFEELEDVQKSKMHGVSTIKILLVVARDLTKMGRNRDAGPELTQEPLMKLQWMLNRAKTRVLLEVELTAYRLSTRHSTHNSSKRTSLSKLPYIAHVERFGQCLEDGPAREQYRDDFLFVYYSRDNPIKPMGPPQSLSETLKSCARYIFGSSHLKTHIFRRAEQKPHTSSVDNNGSGIIPLRLLLFELEVYLQAHRIVYASDSDAHQEKMKETIQSLSKMWLRTNFIDEVHYRKIPQDNSRSITTLPKPHHKESRHTHGYLLGHRLPCALGGILHVIEGQDDVFRLPYNSSQAESENRSNTIRMLHNFLIEVSTHDYVIFLGFRVESNWMPKEWVKSCPRDMKYWSHGSTVYEHELEKPNSLDLVPTFANGNIGFF
ncbi:hypothetical protein PG994_009010 [Apiospora phragmitis]|uniref:Uncharacterized protein n=1 Tax=Apiospora phragmitis TaxID=2905665 RepID=A0ABR1UI42_9PEZI